MTNQIAIIDPFVKSPAINCFNSLVNILGLRATYHIPSVTGIETLLKETKKSQAYIVLGSASHVHEKLPGHGPLTDFLMEELERKKPLLGCCFGHQLICHAFGAQVEYYSPLEQKLMGAREVKIIESFWNFNKDETFHLGVTHKQVVKQLPSALLEVGQGLRNDIVIHRSLPFMGTQAHPEASEYFATNDITNLQAPEISMIQNDGARLIQRFFQNFDLI